MSFTGLIFHRPNLKLFTDQLEIFVGNQNIVLDAQIPQSLAMLYTGMLSMLMRCSVGKINHANRARISIEPHGVIFTVLHSSGGRKWINIFVFHTLAGPVNFMHFFHHNHDEIVGFAQKWGYGLEHVAESMNNVGHILWHKEDTGDMFGGEIVEKLNFHAENMKPDIWPAELTPENYAPGSRKWYEITLTASIISNLVFMLNLTLKLSKNYEFLGDEELRQSVKQNNANFEDMLKRMINNFEKMNIRTDRTRLLRFSVGAMANFMGPTSLGLQIVSRFTCNQVRDVIFMPRVIEGRFFRFYHD